MHILRDCKEASEVWQLVLPPSLIHTFFSLPLRSWLEYNLSSKEFRDVSPSLPKRFAVVCWRQWKWRNDFIFTNSPPPSHQIDLKLVSLYHLFQQLGLAFSISSNSFEHSSSGVHLTHIAWEPPSDSTIKVNVDGASKGTSGWAADGWVLRD